VVPQFFIKFEETSLSGIAMLIRLLRFLQFRRPRPAAAAAPRPAAAAPCQPRRARGPRTEDRFASVFAMLPPPRREGLIRHYQQRFGGSRSDAMERAMEDRAGDEARWN